MKSNRTPNHAELPPSVNYHLNAPCNFGCRYCFARFDDVVAHLGRGMLPRDEQLAVVQALSGAGFDKLTIAGGEPTLVPWLDELFAAFEGTTMLVTNGSRLIADPDLLDRLAPHLDWLVVSVDSARADTNAAIGRAPRRGDTLSRADYVALGRRAQALGLRLKLNTVVNAHNVDESMVELIREVAPERWKILQAMAVDGQNHDDIAQMQVPRSAFDAFVARHAAALRDEPVVLVPEDTDEIRGTYAMVDPAGRFFDSALGFHTYSRPLLEAGVREAFAQVHFDHDGYTRRGGEYDWR
jgi:radical S-adenosyl methionine domain-containing protein 2